MSFQNFQLKIAESREAFQHYCYAGVKLDLAKIHERLAEIESQHEPLATLSGGSDEIRRKLLASAYYVVVGRMPDAYVPKEGGGK